MNREKDWDEANKLYRSALDNTKTTLFRWKPDWEKASTEFEQAAKKYQKIGDSALHECVDSYAQAAQAFYQLGSINSAARNLETAALMSTKIPVNEKNTAELYQQAAKYYAENGQTAKAASTFVLAANVLKEVDTEVATAFYMKACEAYESDEERSVQGTDTFKTTIAYLIKTEQYRDSLMMYDRLTTIFMTNFESKRQFVYRNMLCCIVIALHLQDVELGFNNFQRFSETEGFMESEQSSLCNELLIAFDEGDEERVKQTIKDPLFDLLDAPVARLAKRLRISDALAAAAASRAVLGDENDNADDGHKHFDLT